MLLIDTIASVPVAQPIFFSFFFCLLLLFVCFSCGLLSFWAGRRAEVRISLFLSGCTVDVYVLILLSLLL